MEERIRESMNPFYDCPANPIHPHHPLATWYSPQRAPREFRVIGIVIDLCQSGSSSATSLLINTRNVPQPETPASQSPGVRMGVDYWKGMERNRSASRALFIITLQRFRPLSFYRPDNLSSTSSGSPEELLKRKRRIVIPSQILHFRHICLGIVK